MENFRILEKSILPRACQQEGTPVLIRKLVRKGGRGALDTKSLCAKGGEGGSGYEKFVRKGGRGVLDRKSLCAKGGRGVLDTTSLCANLTLKASSSSL